MIPELGHYALFLALGLAVIQSFAPWRGLASGYRLTIFTAWGQCLFAGLSFASLAFALLTNDFSVAYVARNSNSHLPAVYRFCALWGAHEGSLLLWVFILTMWMAAVTLFSRGLPAQIKGKVLAVMAVIACGFYLFLLTTSNPFLRLIPDIPIDGADLNPILQDPGLAVHPPILYMGYVGFAVPFAFAITALLSGQLDAQWARWSRPWTTIAWSFLTLGIVLGSAWAYRELGWGGWWFWDPVENASFLPWLAGTALIHSLAVTEKRQVFKAWTILLAVCAFSLSLLGTFLVRSGVLVSVHSFASDPGRGLFMLGFLMFVIGGSLIIYAWRGRRLAVSGEFGLASRETMLLANNILLFVAMLTVLLGTLYPLIIDALHLGKLSVGAPYFNHVFGPLMAPVFILMAIAPLFNWRHTQVNHLKVKMITYLVVVCGLAFALPVLIGFKLTLGIFAGIALAFWVILWSLHHGINRNSRLKLPRLTASQWAMLIAHTGVGITLLGIVCSTAYSVQRDVSMHQGDFVEVGPYQFQLRQTMNFKGPNFEGLQATVMVYRHQRLFKVLYPEQRFFPVSETATSKAAIDVGIFRDLYVALGTSLPDGAWSLRIYYKPFVRWIWAGGIMMAIGGLLAVTDRRYRLIRSSI